MKLVDVLEIKMKQPALLEHINFTVRDSQKTADLLCKLFDWKVRWHGPAIDGGATYHVGTDESYIAIYMPPTVTGAENKSRSRIGAFNHLGVVVNDIEDAEKRVESAGYQPHSHDDYTPGKRFYFKDDDGIEYEVVSYS